MPEQDFMPIQNFDHLEFYVGNSKQSAYYFSNAWGFVPIAYAGLETGMRDRSSYVLEQGNVRLVVTSPLGPEGEMAEHVKLHGDGVKSIGLRVDDAERALRSCGPLRRRRLRAGGREPEHRARRSPFGERHLLRCGACAGARFDHVVPGIDRPRDP